VADPAVGHTLGHFRIESKLGEGGMGVVWKARDMRLDRPVALKVLRAEKLGDPDRRRRFVQEAKAASALNHPNIITIYDIGRTGPEEDAPDFIAMELVNGKALDQLIPRKGLRLNEALKYAIQIADALAAAHAAGIVHRDLKPGNVMVNENGLIKVLDFGLSKLTEHGASSEFTPTETIAEAPKTDKGLIVGTVPYMSPEQAEGKNVDTRSDIFSFGALLYEMPTGRRAFQGDSKMSTLAAILNLEPEPIEKMAPEIPREVSRIVQRCLRKDPGRRMHSMVDVKLALEEVKEESESGALAAPAARPMERRRDRAAAAAILLIGTAGAGIWFLRDKLTAPAALQAVPLTSYAGYESWPSISPDGKQVAFSWDGGSQGNFDIYVKVIGSGGPLRLTSHPAEDLAPSWSPDGTSIAFLRYEGGKEKLMLIPVLGGPEREIAELVAPIGLSRIILATNWSPDGRWLVTSAKKSADEVAALWVISPESGEKRQITTPPTNYWGDFYPSFSPDGRTLAFVRFSAAQSGDVYVLPVTPTLNANGEPRRLTNESRLMIGIAWTANGTGIVFSSNRGGTQALWRVAVSGSPSRRLSVGENGRFPAISARANRLVYTQSIADTNIWRINLQDPSDATPLLTSTRADSNPSYSPDGRRVAFESSRSGNQEVWVADADGSNAVQLVDLGRSGSPRWSPDGHRIAFDSNVVGNWQIYAVSAQGGHPERMTKSAANESRPSWSHDGKWIYFGSNRSGVSQVWKMPAGGGPAEQLTRNGGENPFESPDSRTIYYLKNGSNPSPLWKVPAEKGEESQVLDSVNFSQFAVSSGGIYFLSWPRLQYLDFSTGRAKTILTLHKQASLGLCISKDEHWLLYPQVDQGGSDLMLVENFR
jgi:Tol biopolymer transport system component/tRNA A-37 threonylcarbamoyl transferase component Bud32